MLHFKTLTFFFLLAFPFAAICNGFYSIEADTGINTVEISKDFHYKNLPDEAKESSGLIFWEGLLWTHNDSGGDAAIYGIDTVTGTIVRKVFLKGVKNFDWEDITQDAAYIYIGDFGNNDGARKTLFVYKIAKGGITNDKDVVFVPAQQIAFSYADQESFKKNRYAHNFDCEAFFAFEKHLYLFTKNWDDQKTRLYKLPKRLGRYYLNPEESFECGGLITGADISRSGERVALIGYVDFVSFMWLFWDFDGDDFFGGKSMRIDFPEMVFVQTEAVTFTSENELFFSCEESAEAPSLFKTTFDDLINPVDNTDETDANHLFVPGKIEQISKDELSVELSITGDADVLIELLNTRWKVLDEKTLSNSSQESETIMFDIKGFKRGTYFLSFILQNNSADDAVIGSREDAIVKKIEIQ